MAEMRHDARVMAAVSRRILLGLFLRLGILLGLLGGLGGLLALNSELTRAGVTLPLDASLQLFLMGLPEVGFHLLPLCSVVALVWTGAVLRESQSWMGMRLLGLGGRSFWAPVAVFAAVVSGAVGILAGSQAPSLEKSQQELLLRHAEVVPGQAVQIEGLELLAKGGGLGKLSDVRVALESPPLRGAAEQAVVEPHKGVVSLKNGLLIREGEPAVSIGFESFSLELPGSRLGENEHLKFDLEDRKRWSWPLMSALLCFLAWPLSLQGRSVASIASWLGLWGVVRVCDHGLPELGLYWASSLPPMLLGFMTVLIWLRWEDA